MTETATDLVVNPVTGEALAVAAAETEQLAAAVDELADLQGRLRDFGAVIERELLARMDRRASWTLRVGDPTGGVQFELKAPSPDAGTTAYDAEKLEGALAGLIAAGVLDEDGAASALERTVTVTFRVPFGSDLGDLVHALGAVDGVAGVPCTPTSVQTGRKVVARGVKALRKVPGARDAIDATEVEVPAPARRVKVRPIRGAR